MVKKVNSFNTDTEKEVFDPKKLDEIVFGPGACSERLWEALDYVTQFKKEELEASQWKDNKREDNKPTE